MPALEVGALVVIVCSPGLQPPVKAMRVPTAVTMSGISDTDQGHLGVWAGSCADCLWLPGLGRPPLQMRLLPSGGHGEFCQAPCGRLGLPLPILLAGWGASPASPPWGGLRHVLDKLLSVLERLERHFLG